MRRTTWLAVGFGLVVGPVVALAGCAQTTGGSATTAPSAGRSALPVQPDEIDAPLAAFLLGADEVNRVMNATGMTLVGAANGMADEYTATSHPECLGALLNGAKAVYDGTGWTDVVDQIYAEPEANGEHWAEQTIVGFGSHQRAHDFYQSSVRQWADCIGADVVVTDGESDFRWQLDGITVADGVVSQLARQVDSGGWECRHALTAVSRYVVEAAVCGTPAGPEAATLVRRIADRVD